MQKTESALGVASGWTMSLGNGEWLLADMGFFFFEVIKLFKTYIVLMFVHLYGYY